MRLRSNQTWCIYRFIMVFHQPTIMLAWELGSCLETCLICWTDLGGGIGMPPQFQKIKNKKYK
jgi:hypothetical protein